MEHRQEFRRTQTDLPPGSYHQGEASERFILAFVLEFDVKYRYPTFIDAVRDIDDALCMIFLFANLPATSRVSTALIDNCTRLAAEWQLYTLRSHSLRKVFLSIKGVYYQAEVMGQNVTWLVPYQFTQNVSNSSGIVGRILKS